MHSVALVYVAAAKERFLYAICVREELKLNDPTIYQ